jgi:hypothetical protein
MEPLTQREGLALAAFGQRWVGPTVCWPESSRAPSMKSTWMQSARLVDRTHFLGKLAEIGRQNGGSNK